MTDVAGTAQPNPALPKPVVLIVEDDVLVRLLIADHLRESGFSVIEAANALEAVALFGSQVAIDIVFTDHNMPGDMDGQSLARWIEDQRPGLPVIVTSGAFHPTGAAPAHRRFIPKPYVLLDVEHLIRDLLA